jgi:hypothetical protein
MSFGGWSGQIRDSALFQHSSGARFFILPDRHRWLRWRAERSLKPRESATAWHLDRARLHFHRNVVEHDRVRQLARLNRAFDLVMGLSTLTVDDAKTRA